MKATKEEMGRALELLQGWLTPGATVYTILRHVSRTGNTREVSVVIQTPAGNMVHPNKAVATLTGMHLNKRFDAIVTQSGGMDVGFEIVYNLGRAMYPAGICKGTRKCHVDPSKGHSRPAAGSDEGHSYQDAGYAFRQEWL